MTFIVFLMLLLKLGIVGFIVWLILQIPMPELIKNLIVGVTAIGLIYWLITTYGSLLG